MNVALSLWARARVAVLELVAVVLLAIGGAQLHPSLPWAIAGAAVLVKSLELDLARRRDDAEGSP